MEVVNMFKDKTKINVLANVESVNAVKQLIMLGAQDIMTPYADDIGKKLIEKFNIKGIKLR